MKTTLIIARWFFIVVVLLWAVVYISDYVSVRYRMSKNTPGDPIGVVVVDPIIAIQLKGGKIDYELDQTQSPRSEQCVRSLFPHYGYNPCWYLNRKYRQPVSMVVVLPYCFAWSRRTR